MTVLEQMYELSQPSPEFQAEFEACAAGLLDQLKCAHPWVRDSFLKKIEDEATADELESMAFLKFLDHIKAVIWDASIGRPFDADTLTPVFRRIAKDLGPGFNSGIIAREYLEHQWHANLVDHSVPDEFTDEDDWRVQALAEVPFSQIAVEPISPRSAVRALWIPKQWFETVADRITSDHFRRAKRRVKTVELPSQAREGKEFISPKLNPERRLLAQEFRRNFRSQYVAAIRQLPALQRAAWVLSRDTVLTTSQALRFLTPTLSEGKAKTAAARRPMTGADAARLLGRKDVSSDASKAGVRLMKELWSLAPQRPTGVVPPKWSPEFLKGAPTLWLPVTLFPGIR